MLDELSRIYTTPAEAMRAGYTQKIAWMADDGTGGMALVKPDTDIEEDFRAYCLEECEMIRLRGWAILANYQSDSQS